MPQVLFTEAARADLAEALEWYEAVAPRMVSRFRDELRAVVVRIAENPRQFTPTRGQTRRALLRRFPYAVIFRETEPATYVIAVFHTSRDPLRWQERR